MDIDVFMAHQETRRVFARVVFVVVWVLALIGALMVLQ